MTKMKLAEGVSRRRFAKVHDRDVKSLIDSGVITKGEAAELRRELKDPVTQLATLERLERLAGEHPHHRGRSDRERQRWSRDFPATTGDSKRIEWL